MLNENQSANLPEEPQGNVTENSGTESSGVIFSHKSFNGQIYCGGANPMPDGVRISNKDGKSLTPASSVDSTDLHTMIASTYFDESVTDADIGDTAEQSPDTTMQVSEELYSDDTADTGDTGNTDTDESLHDEMIMAEPEPEVIPSLFAGIGKTDWSEPSYDTPEPAADPDTEMTPDPEFDFQMDQVSADTEPDDTDDEIDVDELLDFIEDIEFSGMEAEPLRAVRYIDTSGDPYNTSFNDPSSSHDTTGIHEFDLSDSIKFEKK